MHEIHDVNAHEQLIKDYIKRFGSRPEHHFEYLKCVNDDGTPAFYYDDDMGAFASIQKEGKSKILFLTTDPFSKNPSASLEKLSKYLILEKDFDKIVVESVDTVRKELVKSLKDSKLRVVSPRYSCEWPVFYLKNFDETLSGSQWKKMRYFKNKFFRDHPDATVDDFKAEDVEALKELVKLWTKKRTAGDRAHYHQYLNMINMHFKNFDIAKVIKIGQKPVSVMAGFKIPNSNGYYSSVGIYDYDIENIGEVSNILDLTFIKQLGVEWTDFGGGEAGLTNFKKKFHPDEFYNTDVYAITRKEA